MKKFLLVFLIIFLFGSSAIFAQTDQEIRQILIERIGDADPKAGITIALIDENGVRYIASQPENKTNAKKASRFWQMRRSIWTTSDFICSARDNCKKLLQSRRKFSTNTSANIKLRRQ
jgi:opacity protein-like surface antigen